MYDFAFYECRHDDTLFLDQSGLPKPILRRTDIKTRKLCQADLDYLKLNYTRVRQMINMMDRNHRRILFYGLGRKVIDPDPRKSFLQVIGTDPPHHDILSKYSRIQPGEVDHEVCYIKVVVFQDCKIIMMKNF